MKPAGIKSTECRVLIRGAGELASATAHHLYRQGFQSILMLERRYPKAVRRQVCYSEAILDGTKTIQNVCARFVGNVDEVEEANLTGEIAVAALGLEDVLHRWQPRIFIEAAMLRKNWGLKRNLAPVVIALGPGYVARKDCDAVVDTVRGPQVGSVLEDTGERLVSEPPAEIMGYAKERAVKAVRDGIFFTHHEIGGQVERGERIGTVVSVYGIEEFRQGVPVDASYPVTARISGTLRGLLRDGVPVQDGDRIADIDPRGITEDLNHISDKSHRVAEGVHEALMSLIAETKKRRSKKSTKARNKKTPKSAAKSASKKSTEKSAARRGSMSAADTPKSGSTTTAKRGPKSGSRKAAKG